MWSLIASLASSASGVLAILAVAGGLVGVGALEQHRIDAGTLLKLEQTYKDAQAKAEAEAAAKQLAMDQEALAAAGQEAQAQAKIAATLQQELLNAQKHISVSRITASCVPYGFVRVLYAGSHGVSADSLTLPAGKSDDACSPIGWLDMASAILHDYGQARANGAQLDALIGLLVQEKK